jgi:hypothetical protein
VRRQIRADLLQRAPHARLERHGVQAVQQQQVGDELVAAERRGQRAVVARGDGGHDPRQPLPVHVQQGLHEPGGRVARRRVREGLDLLQERLDPRDPVACLSVVHDSPGLSRARRTSASAPA